MASSQTPKKSLYYQMVLGELQEAILKDFSRYFDDSHILSSNMSDGFKCLEKHIESIHLTKLTPEEQLELRNDLLKSIRMMIHKDDYPGKKHKIFFNTAMMLMTSSVPESKEYLHTKTKQDVLKMSPIFGDIMTPKFVEGVKKLRAKKTSEPSAESVSQATSTKSVSVPVVFSIDRDKHPRIDTLISDEMFDNVVKDYVLDRLKSKGLTNINRSNIRCNIVNNEYVIIISHENTNLDTACRPKELEVAVELRDKIGSAREAQKIKEDFPFASGDRRQSELFLNFDQARELYNLAGINLNKKKSISGLSQAKGSGVPPSVSPSSFFSAESASTSSTSSGTTVINEARLLEIVLQALGELMRERVLNSASMMGADVGMVLLNVLNGQSLQEHILAVANTRYDFSKFDKMITAKEKTFTFKEFCEKRNLTNFYEKTVDHILNKPNVIFDWPVSASLGVTKKK